ncbi:hypothetical protein IWX49DRAFT_557866 [Phyllosticta citricarpa]
MNRTRYNLRSLPGQHTSDDTSDGSNSSASSNGTDSSKHVHRFVVLLSLLEIKEDEDEDEDEGQSEAGSESAGRAGRYESAVPWHHRRQRQRVIWICLVPLIILGLFVIIQAMRHVEPLQQQRQAAPHSAEPQQEKAPQRPQYNKDHFLMLHDQPLKAFGIEKKPGLSASDEEDAACQKAVKHMYREMSRHWHPDHCTKMGLEAWQCAAMLRPASEKVNMAKELCYNRNSLEKYHKERREARDQEHEERRMEEEEEEEEEEQQQQE